MNAQHDDLRSTAKKGFTILEIMLALLILGGAMAALGQLSRNALRNARESRDMTQAELLAESILAKVQLGIIEKEAAYQVPITNLSSTTDIVVDSNAVSSSGGGDALWVYTLEITDIDADYGLQEIAVTVTQNMPEEHRPLSCRLVKWFALEPEEDETSSTSSTGSTGSSSSTGSGSSSGTSTTP